MRPGRMGERGALAITGQHFVAPHGAAWRAQNKTGAMLYVALKGALRIQSDDGDLEASPSYAAYVPAGVDHGGEAHDSDGQVFAIELPTHLCEARGGLTPRRLEDSHSYYLISSLISGALSNTHPFDRNLLLALSKHLIGHDDAGRDDWFTLVVDAISELKQSPQSLGALADLAGMHPMTLTKKFRRRHGCSMGEFRQRVRAERAFYRVVKQFAPLSDISLICGYADQSHMTREFRRFFALTPAFLRRATAEKV